MKKCVIYARYSHGPNQTEQSIEGQLMDCSNYAKEHDLVIVKTYTDKAKTGTNDNREAFQQMLRDSAKGLFDVVLVWKIDRFGRNREEMALNKVKLRKNDVQLITVKENIPDGPEGVLIESLMEGLAEYYSLNLAQNIRRGLNTNALKAKVNGGHVAFGFRISKDHHFEVVEELRPVIVEIFTLYDSGWSFKDICDHLNAKGIRTSRGNRFNKSTLRPMLSNVKYIGTYKYKDVVIENAFPAIVDKALFDRVQIRLKASLQHRQAYRKKVVYMLSGKIFCNKCGAPYIADAGTSKSGKVYNYYVCEDKKKRKNCKNKTYSKDVLDNIVIKTTLKYVLTADRIEKIADNLIRINEKRNESPYLSKLICDKAESEKKINNILSAIEEGIFTPSTKERLLALEAEVKNLEAAITEENIKKPPLTKEAVLWFLNRLKKLNYSDEQCKDQLVKTLIHSVRIDDDRVIINYNYTNNDGITAFAECSSDSKMVDYSRLEMNTIYFYLHYYSIVVSI